MIKVRGGSLKNISILLDASVSKSIGNLGVELTKALRDGTPKDTTHASQEWVPSVNFGHIGEIGSKASPKVDITSQLERIRNFDFKRGDRSIHIVNNTPYLPVLNRGYSSQAGYGFIESITDKCVDVFNTQGTILTKSS